MGISVAMCTYNGTIHLREQLESIAGQSRLPDELIGCDDSSTDDTISILEEFATRAPFATRVIKNLVNLGYRRNFVKAVELCSQDVIALCDQDDIWYSRKLALIEESFRSDPAADGLFSDGDLIGADSKRTGRRLWESFSFGPDAQKRFNSGGAIDELLRRNVVTGMSFAFRSRVRELLIPLPDSWIHDGWMAFLLAARSKLIAFPEPLVAYRVHGSQQVGTPISVREKIQWIRNKGPNAYFVEMHRRNLDEYQRTATQFDDLAQFLGRNGRSEEIDLIAKVKAKADHARRGAMALSSPRARRWSILASHLVSYSRFSPTGLRAIPRDFLV